MAHHLPIGIGPSYAHWHPKQGYMLPSLGNRTLIYKTMPFQTTVLDACCRKLAHDSVGKESVIPFVDFMRLERTRMNGTVSIKRT